jgi:tetratricopeptide (TPR) repeat protein
MRKPLVQTLIVVASVGALMSSAATLQAVRERRYPAPPIQADSLYITSGASVRRLTAGYNVLAADLYWIRTIQYYGDAKLALKGAREASGAAQAAMRATSGYPLLYPLLDLTTSLDPRFNIAYRFGAVFLAEAYPGGAGRPDLAIALLEKGLRERPDKWEYMQDIGFVHYWWTHDFSAAADWFRRASEVPGAPWFLRSLAATTLAEGGDRRSSRLMWQSIAASAEIEWLRNEADRRLKQLDAFDQIEALQKLVDDYTKREGAPPDGWAALVRARLLRGIPVDPARSTPYEIDPSGRVRL